MRRVLLTAVPLMHSRDGELEPMMMDKTRDASPMAVYLLARMLREEGFDAGILDLIAEGKIDEKKVLETVSGYDVLGISVNSINWPTARYLIKMIRKANIHIPIILGGVHPTLYDDYLLHHFPIDFIIRGEAEYTLPRLIRYLRGEKNISEIEGLSYLDKKGNLVRNRESLPLSISELENLPAPAYDLLPDGVYRGLGVESSRGCRFGCAFCSIMYKRSWRPLSPQAFVKSVERLQPFIHKTVQDCFHVVDDCFTTDRQRVLDIIRLAEEKELFLGAALDARCSDITDLEFALALKKITKVMLLGAECGYDEGLRKIGKGITVATIEQAARILHQAGLASRAVFSFVLGLPWEGFEEVIKTVNLAASLSANYGVILYLQWHCLLPGSAIWNRLAKRGEVDIAMYDDFGFFADRYLTRKAVSLDFGEVFRLAGKVATLKGFLEPLKREDCPVENLVEFAVPPAILQSEAYQSLAN